MHIHLLMAPTMSHMTYKWVTRPTYVNNYVYHYDPQVSARDTPNCMDHVLMHE